MARPEASDKVRRAAAFIAGDDMRDRRRPTIETLRQAIDCLPRTTRIAMLQGIDNNPIIVGAYATDGGICPMLAAHRCGGRTDFIQFAKAWDRFAFRESRRQRARAATERELRVLRTHLEASLMEDLGAPPDLGAAVLEHRILVHQHEQSELAERAAAEQRLQAGARARRYEQRQASRRSRREHPRIHSDDRDRTPELRERDGWAWTTLVRRYDDYERALQRLEAQQELLPERHREPVGA